MGLILIGSNISGLKSWVEVTDRHREQIFSKTKRPTTYLIPVTEDCLLYTSPSPRD